MKLYLADTAEFRLTGYVIKILEKNRLEIVVNNEIVVITASEELRRNIRHGDKVLAKGNISNNNVLEVEQLLILDIESGRIIYEKD